MAVTKKNLIPFMYKNDMNWYLNPDKLPHYDLILETISYVENEQQGLFKTIDFLNLVQWHYDKLQKSYKKPFDYIEHIRTIHLSEKERHVLVAIVLKWFGGIPLQLSVDDPARVLKRMLQEEFLKQMDGHVTSEKTYVLHGIKYSIFPIAYKYWDVENKVVVSKEEENMQEYKYDFDKVKKHMDGLPDTRAKIQYLISMRTSFRQNSSADELRLPNKKYFDDLCDIELQGLKELDADERAEIRIKYVEPKYKLSRVGSKADFIRIFNAVHALKLIALENGEIPTKEQFMKQVGSFFGSDLSTYDTDLSQALQGTIETNLNVFEKMIAITTSAHIQRNK